VHVALTFSSQSLIPVANRPLLDYALECLMQTEVKDVIVLASQSHVEVKKRIE
jgi:dTDP-glucose pyrophosphorylase